MRIKVQSQHDRSDILDRVDMASLLVDIGFADVDPDADDQLLFCVFHNDSGTRSFSVNLEKKLFKCWSPSCGLHRGGTAITLYALWKRVSYQQACQEIAYLPRRRDLARLQEAISRREPVMSALARVEAITRFVLAMPYLTATPLADALRRRGISDEVMDGHGLRAYDEAAASSFDPEVLFRAGLANAWRRPVFSGHPILFPFRMGRQYAFVQGRLAQDDPNRPKYLGARGSISCLFNHAALASRPERVFLTEGVVDALSLEQVGLAPALGIVGADGFKDSWAEDFRSVRQVYIATDHDAAGEAGVGIIAEKLRSCGAELLRLSFPSSAKDINEAVVGGWHP